jgi:hypothetical protein
MPSRVDGGLCRADLGALAECPGRAVEGPDLDDVLGGHLRVGGAQQVLAVEVLLGLTTA